MKIIGYRAGSNVHIPKALKIRYDISPFHTVFLLLLGLLQEYSGVMRQQISRLAVGLFLALFASQSAAMSEDGKRGYRKFAGFPNGCA